MSDHDNQRGSGPRSRPVPSGAPLGQVPIVLEWVREQEARRGVPAAGAAQTVQDRGAHGTPEHDEFDLPIPDAVPRGVQQALPRLVVPPPATPVYARASAPPDERGQAQARTSQHFGEPPSERHSLSNSRPAPGFASPITQRHSLPNSQAPGRASQAAPRGSEAPLRVSRGPAAGSHAPRRRTAPPVDDPRWVFGRALLDGGRKGEALLKLEELYYVQPEHEPCRIALLDLYLEMRNPMNVAQHADWVVQRHLEANRAAEGCDTYRRVRTTCLNLAWSERALALLTVAGERLRDTQVVVDATKLLLQAFPDSSLLPRALFATAHCQLEGGRPDLARATLQHLTRTFPMDAVAGLASQKLRELDGA